MATQVLDDTGKVMPLSRFQAEHPMFKLPEDASEWSAVEQAAHKRKGALPLDAGDDRHQMILASDWETPPHVIHDSKHAPTPAGRAPQITQPRRR